MTDSLFSVREQEDGGLVAELSPLAPVGTTLRYCFPWDGPRLLFIQGEYLAPVYCDPGTIVRFRAFLGRKAISEVLSVTTSRGHQDSETTPTVLVPRTQNRDFSAYDWGTRHRAVCDLVRTEHPRLILIGDSITHFWGGLPSDPNRPDYMEVDPEGWNRSFGEEQVANLGFGNDRIENVLWRMQHGELEGVHPEACCVLLIGTNNLSVNTNEQIVMGIEKIITEFMERLPKAKLLIQGIYPRQVTEVTSDWNDRIDAINEKLRELVDESQGNKGVTCLHFANPGRRLLDSTGQLIEGATRDGLHPTQLGYRLIAEELIPAIAQL